MPSPAKAAASTDAQAWNRLLSLHAQVEGRLAAVIQRRHGLGLSEYRALAFLNQADNDELRMQELADKLGLNQSSVTRLVNRLNAADFTRRDLCPDDKRGVYTVLTEAGRERYREASTTYAAALAAALDEIALSDPATAAIITAARDAI
ncbi:MAG: MarR family transcriptional regulator [Catenulispora sp.]|nr:MarR family transcriptional regulator [Catenulispora sp.]